MVYVNYEFVLCTLFFLCTFWLRNIKDEFSINTEIRVMTTILFVSDFLYISSIILLYNTVFVVLGFIQYIEVMTCLSLLYVTAIRPILKSYKPNPIIPFPLNQDCIEQLESAMMMPASSQMFYEFINDLGDIRGITLMALYADLRLYMNMVNDHLGENDQEELVKQAHLVYADYLVEGNTYEMEPNEIIHELRRGYNARSGQIEFNLDSELFQALYDFCIGALEVYYAVFKKSDRFEELRDEVDRQEIMYHVLRKYNLISN